MEGGQGMRLQEGGQKKNGKTEDEAGQVTRFNNNNKNTLFNTNVSSLQFSTLGSGRPLTEWFHNGLKQQRIGAEL